MLPIILSLLTTALHVHALPTPPTRIDTVAASNYWHRLLHFRPTVPFGTKKSEIDGKEFFFSPDGKTDARAELVATVDAFSKDLLIGPLQQHPQCAFPERYRYLKGELGLTIPDIACTQLDEFLERFKAESVTLVFSSAYPNNPGSMFGHTFLRINAAKPAHEKKLDILDFGLNFAAAVGDDENPLAFMWFGLTGGYEGRFSMLPYYVKVNEYSNAESRDIWEYDLALTPEETRRLLLHVWELGTTSHIDYFFFDENCSYQLLTLLEVAKPDWQLTTLNPYTIPGESVKKVMDIPGSVRQVTFRPSLRKKMLQRFEALDGHQQDAFHRLLASRSVDGVDDPALLETVSAYLFYEKQRREGKLSDGEKAFLAQTLVQRSRLGKSPTLPFFESNASTRPDLGHHSYRLGTAGGVTGGKSLAYFQELSFKTAYHDLMNKDLGFVPYSQIDFPAITLRYLTAPRQLQVENLNFLTITSLFPLSLIDKKLSWRLVLDYFAPKDFGCQTCHVFRGEGGAGVSASFFSDRAIAYALALANLEVGNAFGKGYRFGPRLQLATIFNVGDDYKSRFALSLATDLNQSERSKLFYLAEWEQSLALSREWELRALFSHLFHPGEAGRTHSEAKASLIFYF